MFYLSVLRVYVLMKTSDNSAVNKKAPHNHDGFQNLPQCDLERKREEIIVSSAQKIGWWMKFGGVSSTTATFCPLAFTIKNKIFVIFF